MLKVYDVKTGYGDWHPKSVVASDMGSAEKAFREHYGWTTVIREIRTHSESVIVAKVAKQSTDLHERLGKAEAGARCLPRAEPMKRYSIWIGTKRRDGYLASDVADLELRLEQAMSFVRAFRRECDAIMRYCEDKDMRLEAQEHAVKLDAFFAEGAGDHTSQ